MARYINEDEFVAWVKEHWCADCQNDNGLRCRACWIDDAIDIVEEAPPADVVPKSEVERLQNILDSYALQYGTVMDKHIVIERARAEVAREISIDVNNQFLRILSCFDEVERNGSQEERELASKVHSIVNSVRLVVQERIRQFTEGEL